MGSACCVAARDRTISNRNSGGGRHRSIKYDTQYSFGWDNRVANEVGNTTNQSSEENCENVGLEITGRVDGQREDVSDGGSPLDNFRRPTWQKSAVNDGAIGNSTTPVSDLSMGSSFSMEVKDSIELAAIAESSTLALPLTPKLSFSTPSTSSLSTQRDSDPTISQERYSVHGDATPSRWARRSPGHQLLRGISDTRILGLKSPNNNSTSSDGWSMRTFSELVASSQRDRWSFDSESLDTCRGKITRSNSRLFASPTPSIDLKSCGVCSKLLTERSSWSSQKIIANELSVVAVLVCGHAYHADCLENMTSETERYDPSCPACTIGEKQALKISMKQLREADMKVRSSWMSRNRVVDSDIEGSSVLSSHGKVGPKMGQSSSMKNSFVKPFLKRHFSLGAKSTRGLSVNESSSAKRKGFWVRYR
ncbi:hypothetical protein ACHQM5_015402 [Ranunculus cassubicifolius]